MLPQIAGRAGQASQPGPHRGRRGGQRPVEQARRPRGRDAREDSSTNRTLAISPVVHSAGLSTPETAQAPSTELDQPAHSPPAALALAGADASSPARASNVGPTRSSVHSARSIRSEGARRPSRTTTSMAEKAAAAAERRLELAKEREALLNGDGHGFGPAPAPAARLPGATPSRTAGTRRHLTSATAAPPAVRQGQDRGSSRTSALFPGRGRTLGTVSRRPGPSSSTTALRRNGRPNRLPTRLIGTRTIRGQPPSSTSPRLGLSVGPAHRTRHESPATPS